MHWCEFYSIDEIITYPNPANQEVFIKLTNPLSPDAILTIYDLEGHTVLKLPNFCSSEPIDLSHFPKGYYFFKVENNQHIYKGKFIVNR